MNGSWANFGRLGRIYRTNSPVRDRREATNPRRRLLAHVILSSAFDRDSISAVGQHRQQFRKTLRAGNGHDLRACHRKAKELGLHEVFKELPVDGDAMRMLVGLNDQQGLRYIKTGMKHFPLWSIVEPLAVRLHQAVAPLVGFKSFDKSYQGYQ